MKKTALILFIVLLGLTLTGFGSSHAKSAVNIVDVIFVSSQGKKIKASYNIASEKVTLSMPDGTTITLPAAISASGARYSNGTLTFWEHQGTATLYKGEQVLFVGKEAIKELSPEVKPSSPDPEKSIKPANKAE